MRRQSSSAVHIASRSAADGGTAANGTLTDLGLAFALTLLLAEALRRWLALPEPASWHALVVLALIAVPLALFGPRTGLLSGIGAANRVTLLRAVFTALVAGLLPQAQMLGGHAWWLVVLASLPAVLDGADGWVARRRGASAFGARFDMELDAFFVLVLSVWMVALDRAGLWVLLIGALRYLFIAAGQALPALRAPLPDSFRRKAVCVWQQVTLIACLAPVVADPLATVALVVALLLLLWSFARDILWLLRNAADGQH
jgi:phosphatidylglycerophosphate synthase